MSNTIVFSRRGVHVWNRKGRDYTALFVPADDQVVTLRDLTASTEEISQRMRSEGRVPLWREQRGQIKVYGLLPAELAEVRQALSVFLVEDFAPPGCSAFFFVFDAWVVHGVREIDDERRDIWRSTALNYEPGKKAEGLNSAVADLLLRFPAKEITVAVEGSSEDYQALKQQLAALGVNVVPFAALRPQAKSVSLYRHRNYTMPMLLSLGVLGVAFLGLLASVLLNLVESSRLTEKIADIQRQIQAIQISVSLGYIREPQPILAEMRKPFDQQPSAIVDAAARFGRALGELSWVGFDAATPATQSVARDGLMPVTVKFDKTYDKLLVRQETTANQLLTRAPWVRSAASQPGRELQLEMMLQIAAPPGVQMPSATTVFQPVLPPPEDFLRGQP